MNRFFDDLWAALRLRFQPVTYYRYPLALILLVLIPSLFEWLLIGPGGQGALTQIFTQAEYGYLFFYLTGLVQLFLYGWMFKVFLWPKNKTVLWSNVVSFLSLTYLIDACSLFFYFSAYTLFLANFVKAFALVLMLVGLKTLSGRGLFPVLLSWISAFIAYVLCNSVIFFIALEIGMIDYQKYEDYVGRQFESLGMSDLIKKLPESIDAKAPQ